MKAYLWRCLVAVLSSFSRTFNVFFLNGRDLESTSARSYREPWPKAIRFIDKLLWIYESDHCRKAWEKEVRDARTTLARADLMTTKGDKNDV
jgi:hypothetical protein